MLIRSSCTLFAARTLRDLQCRVLLLGNPWGTTARRHLLHTGAEAAAKAEAALGPLRTDPFNAYKQYAAVDIDVTAIAGNDLAARLPGSWLPLAKNTPLFENAMRQRGYLVRSPVLLCPDRAIYL